MLNHLELRGGIADTVREPSLVLGLITSSAQKDIVRGYDVGVSSFVSRPIDGLVEAMRALLRCWFQIVDLPA